MKIVVDMSMSPLWVACLTDAGHDAVHWSSVGDVRAKDRVIMDWAARAGRAVLTNDLDFGAILAATGATSPNVLQLRTADVLPDTCGPRVVGAIERFRAELESGALISIDPRSDRARVLPVRRAGVRPS